LSNTVLSVMKINITNFSIVVLAQSNNPSILNPDFLKNNKIVDSSFTPKKVICTPPISEVTFSEAISIIAEFERIQFIDTNIQRIPDDSPIPEIAKKYIEVLRHVRYIATGINFTGHYLCPDKDFAESFLLKRFIKEGEWLSIGDTVQAGLKFIYSFGETKNTISIDSAELIKSENEKNPIILFNVNCHHDTKDNGIDKIKSFISNWQIQFERFNNFIEKILPEA